MREFIAEAKYLTLVGPQTRTTVFLARNIKSAENKAFRSFYGAADIKVRPVLKVVQ